MRALALAAREEAEMVWCRRTPVDGGEAGTGGGERGWVIWEDMVDGADGEIRQHTASHNTQNVY